LARDRWALERPPGAVRFIFRVKIQHHPCDFTPVSTFNIRIEQAQIRDEMFVARTLTMQELLAAEAGRLMSA
jgi:hypothetical protein